MVLLIPIAVGSAVVTCTILVHALPLSATISFVRREKRLGHLGIGFRKDMGVVMRVILYAFVATSARPTTTRRSTTRPWGMVTSS